MITEEEVVDEVEEEGDEANPRTETMSVDQPSSSSPYFPEQSKEDTPVRSATLCKAECCF